MIQGLKLPSLPSAQRLKVGLCIVAAHISLHEFLEMPRLSLFFQVLMSRCELKWERQLQRKVELDAYQSKVLIWGTRRLFVAIRG